MTHGATASPARLLAEPRTQEIADGVRQSLPLYAQADETTVGLLAVTLRRVERAAAAIARVDEETDDNPLAPYMVETQREALGRLRSDLRSWIRLAAELSDRLGLSPKARLGLGADVLQVERGIEALIEQGRATRAGQEAR